MTGPQLHRIMYDTDTPGALTATKVRAPLLATYADLMKAPRDVPALIASGWPQVVLIDRGLGDPLGLASVIDVERGIHRASDAPAWYDRQHKAGIRYLTVYCDRSTLPAVNAVMGNRPFYRWLATLDGTAHVPPFAPGAAPAAVQIVGADRPAGGLGFHADLSIVFEDWWHPAPPAAAPGASWAGRALADARIAEDHLTAVTAALKAHQ